MENVKFDLKEQEYITLVNVLKVQGVISTGGEIIALIEEERIIYNGEQESRKRKKLYKGDFIIIKDEIKITII